MANPQRKCTAYADIHAFAGAIHSRLGATRTKTTVKKLQNTYLIRNKPISTKLPIRLPSTHS